MAVCVQPTCTCTCAYTCLVVHLCEVLSFKNAIMVKHLAAALKELAEQGKLEETEEILKQDPVRACVVSQVKTYKAF